MIIRLLNTDGDDEIIDEIKSARNYDFIVLRNTGSKRINELTKIYVGGQTTHMGFVKATEFGQKYSFCRRVIKIEKNYPEDIPIRHAPLTKFNYIAHKIQMEFPPLKEDIFKLLTQIPKPLKDIKRLKN